MRAGGGCGVAVLAILFVVVGCLVFVALAGAIVLTGEVPLYGPRLTDLEPKPGYPFRPTTPIILTFDQPMDPASVEAAFTIEPDVYGSFDWNDDYTQVTFTPEESGYQPGTSYHVQLAAGAQAGTLPRTTTQTTEWNISLPPLVDTQTPPIGVADLGAWTSLEVTFNYALDCAPSLRAFSITPEAVGVLRCKDQTFTFELTQPLAPDTAYVASVDPVYLADDPSPRPGPRWEFQTAPPLNIVDVSPAKAYPWVDLWTPVRITFSRPVVPETVVARFSLVAQDGLPVAGQVKWEDSGATFVFQPEEPLKPGSNYRLVLQDGVLDELGFASTESVEREYSTATMLGLPLPVPGSRNVPLDSTIRIPFTRPMDKISAEASVVFSPTLEGEVAWEEDTLVFTPLGGLVAEMVYEVSLDPQMHDASGAPLAEPARWTFETEPFLLRTQSPPAASLEDLQWPIKFTFALPMDRASVEAALLISPATSGEFVWSDGDRMVVFQPDPGWLAGVEYEITLSGSARTADGYQTLDKERVLSFDTAAAEVQFGEGPNAQVMDVEGERAFQVVFRGADTADFALYPITPTQFLDLYSSSFRGIGPQDAQFVDTTGLTPLVSWREVLVPLSEQRYDSWQPAEAYIPADVPPGMYILASTSSMGGAEGEEQNSRLLVVLTRHALVLNRALAGSGSQSQAQVVAWDAELGDGGPVISATVRLYDRDGVFLAEGVTDADGLLALEVPGDPGPLVALSEKDGDWTVCGLGNEWSEGGWWWWWTEPPSRPLYVAYSYTDRPIYRPSQTVFFKEFIRADHDVSYTVPSPDLPVTVRLRDARDNVAATQVFTPTQFGTIHGEFQLADEPMLGTWSLETEITGTVSREPFKVEEYRKPEYEVLVLTPEKAYAHGEVISVSVEANYYFGQPVADAEVVLQVYPFYPDYLYEYAEPGFGYPLHSEEGRTDAQGRWTAVIPTDDVFSRSSRASRAMLALEATVVDDSAQSVSSYQTVLVQRTSQGLTLLLEKQGYEPDEEILFTALVRNLAGEPVAGVELEAQVLGWDKQAVAVAAATTDAAGEAYFSVSLPEQGWYSLHVRGADDGGREMHAEEAVWVYDPSGQAPWYGGHWEEKQTLSVSADRMTYQVGDEAQLVIYSQVPGLALLTFERGETRHAEPVTLVSGTNLITVPIRPDFAPNIYVAVNQFGPVGVEYTQSRPEFQLREASTQLLVPMSDKLLTVTLTAGQDTYSPGGEATFQVQVVDHQGQPVVAEVSLAVVDEAIYALAEDMSQDPFEVFYAARPNVVCTHDSMRPFRWLFPEGPGLGGGEDEAIEGPRRDFLDTAYWAPVIITDENGEATITFELPDNLTEWRALARAVTTDTQVGQATTHVVVSQDVVVRPVLPRFLTQGDTLALTAMVHNFSEQPVSATVELELANLQSLVTNTQQIVHVPAGGSATVGWPVLAEEEGVAQVTVWATATRGTRLVGRDAVELPLPVHPFAVPEVATAAGELTPEQPTATLTVTLPSDAIEGLSRLEINMAPSVAPGLLQGLQYLIDYPFG